MGSSELKINFLCNGFAINWKIVINTHKIMAVVAVLLVTDEQSIFTLEKRHSDLVDPAILNYIASILKMSTNKMVEVGGSFLNKIIKRCWNV